MRKITSLVILAWFSHSACADRFYVDGDAPAGGNGLSWATAFQFLQDALDQTVASRGDEVWIAGGVYYPVDRAGQTSDRVDSFNIKDQVRLFGGFQGDETSVEERVISANETSLSGSFRPEQQLWSLHVCTVEANATIGLDGLTIRDGNANGTGAGQNTGAAVYGTGTPVIEVNSCVFSNNSASVRGGVANGGVWTVSDSTFSGNSAGENSGVADGGTWVVTDSTFSDNSAGEKGGIAYEGSWTVRASRFIGNSVSDDGGVAYLGNWTVTTCTFIGNAASNSGGVSYLGDWTVTDSTFRGNSAAENGGVAYRGTWSVTGSVFYQNSAALSGGVSYITTWTAGVSTFSGNTAATGGGVARFGTWTLTNSIVDSLNTTDSSQYLFEDMISFSNAGTKNIIQLGSSVIEATTLNLGTGLIIDQTPLFVDDTDPDGADDVFGTSDDGLRLQAGSPAIGEGDLALLPNDTYDVDGDGAITEPLPLDRAGVSRVQDGSLDLGAYEYGNSVQQFLNVAVLSDGNGSVNPSGIQNYSPGAMEVLVATPNPGYLFDGWSGGIVSSENPVVITINSNLSITGHFTPDLGDPDEDGLSNFDEIVTYGSNPNVGDTSGDGILDGVVASTGFNPNINYADLINLGRADVTNNPSAYNLYSEAEVAQIGAVAITNSGSGLTLEWTVETNSTLNASGWQVNDRIVRPVDVGSGVLFLRVRADTVSE